MNIDKAREHFSAYFEGTMDRGLRQAFERRLQEDAQIAAEYQAFEQTMTELGLLANLTIEVPEDLHERIAARVDRHAWDAKQSKPAAGFLGWLRPALLVVSAAAVGGLAFLQMNGGVNRGSVSEANLTGVSRSATARLEVKAIAKGVSISVPRGGAGALVIRGAEGQVLDSLNLEGKPFGGRDILNEGSGSRLISVTLDNQATVWLALPGSAKVDSSVNEGSLRDMAKSLAGRFQIPVVLEVSNADQVASWTGSASSALEAVAPAVQGSGLGAEVKGEPDSILWIQQSR